ncbi:hypothetical protein GCM10007973_05590 [Polymorphobacter multimanifer]|uniref:Uncharacterized protein (DUF2141 family) n=1 Tax=Polymorphobacter multimanifer TaxID=1070431 RepID=A0A841LCR0_9SPHN|nr:DUF2141 domain-containing protein [Polymorphobacter multimanifer]MBB6226768.1 uncharacterized protein (DUF2141 family) [Polymorphobacter multimanifer]GGI71494.1 hypothetical protein GCM10007973_05590 [Polymorphobacter multimanifer]
MRILLLAALVAAPAAAEDLTVNLESLRVPKGKIVLCLWNSATKFPDCDAGQPAQRVTIDAADADKPVVFKDVPPGVIAVSAFHDENGNGKFDTNFIGLPLEGTAASNNAKPRMGPPSYKAASFRFASSTSIRLRFFYL